MNIKKSNNYGEIGSIKDARGLEESWKQFKKIVLKKFPVEKDPHFFHHIYKELYGDFFDELYFYIELCNFLNFPNQLIFDLRRSYFEIHNSDLNRVPEAFQRQVDYVINNLSVADELLMGRLNLLDKLECFRMAEAMGCLEDQHNLELKGSGTFDLGKRSYII